MTRALTIQSLVLPVLLLCAGAAEAHTGTGAIGGLLSGFQHPIFGLDHLVAMVAVGLWGAFLGAPAIWILPVVFPLVMAFGGVLGILGVPLPHVETWIALSAVVLGLCVLSPFRPPLWVAATIVGAFGLFHGHAHGTELPNAANPLTYSIGFVLATGLLMTPTLSRTFAVPRRRSTAPQDREHICSSQGLAQGHDPE